MFATLLLVHNSNGNGIMEAEKHLRDEVCDDDPAYADGCAKHADIPNYCQDQEEFMRKNCPKSCGFCTEGIQSSPEASIIGKAPKPEECYDKKMNCNELKSEGKCTSTDPIVEHDVKSNCLITCGFCNPDIP